MHSKEQIKWFEHVIRVTEEKIPTKMLHSQMEGKRRKGRPKNRWINQIRKGTEMRAGNWKKCKKKGSGRIDMTVVINP